MRRDNELFGSRVARRVLFSFLVASCVPLAIFAVLASFQVDGAVEQRALAQLDGLTRNIGQQLLDRLLIANDALDYVAANGSAAHLTGLTSAEFVDATEPPGAERAQTAADERAGSGKTRLTASGSNVVLEKRLPQGAVVGRVDPDYLWSMANLLPFGVDLCVFESQSLSPLFCTYELDVDTERQMRDALASDSRGNLLLTAGDERRLAVFWELFVSSRFESAPWSIVVSQPTALAYEARSAFNRALLPTAAASAILILLLSISQIRRTLTPLRRLVAGTREIARRRFAVRMPEDTGDEFGELGEAMNEMAGRLGRQFDVLTTFAEIDRLILSAQSMEHVLDRVLERVSAIMPELGISVLVLDPDDGRHARLFSPAREPAAGALLQRVELRPPTLRWLNAVGDGVVCNRGKPEELARSLGLTDPGAPLVAVALSSADRVRGALLARGSPPREVERHELDTLRELAGRLTVAVSAADRQRDLFNRAHFDQLTGLPNRQLCLDRVEQSLASARRAMHRLGVLFLDLDGFKNVNDSLGHTAGDKLLVEASQRLTQVVRETDTVARVGGDEYVVLLPHVQGALEVEGVARKIIDTLKQPYVLDGRECLVSVSIGAAIFPEDGTSTEELLRRADTAMYSAKDSGRGRCTLFSEELDERVQERLLMQSDLRSALANGEFHVVYQPQVDLASNTPVAAEALLRWYHPKRGAVPPGIFVPILEESGLIEDIGRWVLERALEDLVDWRRRGLPLERVAVNLASRQLIDRDLVRFVTSRLADRGLEGSSLELELTEHGLVSDFVTSNRLFRAFRGSGIRIAIDDFGTGYSSLGYLKELEFDALKVDRTFVTGVAEGKAFAIVEAVSKVAHALGKSIVAEGIETRQQRALLAELGCDLGQGYFFCRPLPSHDIREWASRWAVSRPTRRRA